MSRWFRAALVVVAALALGIRILGVRALLPVNPAGDNYYFHEQANLLASGHWFVQPFIHHAFGTVEASAIHPPLYTIVLSIGSILGFRSFGDHAYLSCLLGTATVVVIALLARRLAGDVAGVAAGVLAALYPNLWLHDTVVMSETLYALVVAVLLYVAVTQWEHPTRRGAVVVGALVGAAILTRGEGLLFVPLLLLPLYLRGRGREWRSAVVALGVAAALVLPWTVWNTIRFGTPVLVSVNSSEVIALANCPPTYYGLQLGYWTPECYYGHPTGNEAERGTYWRELGLRYASHHRGRLPVVIGARIGGSFGVFRPMLHVRFGGNEGRDWHWGRLGMFAYDAMVPLALIGLWALRRRGKPLWPMLAPWFVVLGTSILIYGAIRFRVAAEVPLVVLAGVTIGSVASLTAGRLHGRSARS
jgi:4-amino-4-deoxy-L-arabinose transferase-like glycosyltransferase